MERLSKVLEHLDDVSVVQLYSNIVYEIINMCDIKWMKDFYSESPNWLMNWNIQNKRKTIEWCDKTIEEKKRYLDDELEDYFNIL